jgi:hypothetical protein
MLYITEEDIERKIFVHFLRTGAVLEPRYFETKNIQNREIDFMRELGNNKPYHNSRKKEISKTFLLIKIYTLVEIKMEKAYGFF